MKLQIVLLFLFILNVICVFSQNLNDCTQDASYHNNGKIASVISIDSRYNYCGIYLYKEFDSTGVLLVEGQYEASDSIICKECYTGQPQHSYLKGTWASQKFASVGFVKVGTWKYYHPNGQVKMFGEYSGKVHSYTSSVQPFVCELSRTFPMGKPVPIGVRFDPLKVCKWEYFDENGMNYLTEEFIDGVLFNKIFRVE